MTTGHDERQQDECAHDWDYGFPTFDTHPETRFRRCRSCGRDEEQEFCSGCPDHSRNWRTDWRLSLPVREPGHEQR